MKADRLNGIALICVILAGVWLALMIVGVVINGTVTSLAQAVQQAGRSVPANMPAAVAAGLLTVAVVVFFAELYTLLKFESPFWAVVALLFIPVYGTFNLVACLSHIRIDPDLLSFGTAAPMLTNLLASSSSGVVINSLNLLAYSILAVPSIIFGVLVAQRGERKAGRRLTLSGIVGLLGFAGILIQNDILALGVILGGLLFLAALAPLARQGFANFMGANRNSRITFAKRSL